MRHPAVPSRGLTATVIAIAVLITGCSTPATPPGSTPTAANNHVGTAATTPAITPAPLAPATDESPEHVTAIWMAATCPTDYREPRLAGPERAAAVTTPAGHAADEQAAPSDENWAGSVRLQTVIHCTHVVATIVPGAEPPPDTTFVRATATRTLLDSNGFPADSWQITQTRRVCRGHDGHWLVDIPVGRR